MRVDGNPYVDTKVASEQVVLQAHAAGEIGCTVIRPGDVYGPGSRPWTLMPLELIRQRRFLLPAMGRGVFSPVYVDDLVDGLLLAAEAEAGRHVFTLTGGAAVTTREFFGAYARMLGRRGVPVRRRRWRLPSPRSVWAAARGRDRDAAADDALPRPPRDLLDREGAADARLRARGRPRRGHAPHRGVAACGGTALTVIRFLIADAYPVGGTIRTTFNLAGELARTHDVEVVSVYRHQDRPALELDSRVRLRALADLRPDRVRRSGRLLAERPSRLIHRDDVRYRRFNLLTDVALLRFLRSVREGVLVGTRPGLNLAIARHARSGIVRVGQDHMNLEYYRPALVRALAADLGRLDAVAALTEETAAGYRTMLGSDSRVVCIPNAAPRDRGLRSSGDSKVVMAAGTLERRKGFDRLLKAWAQVAPEFPDWSLEIFGGGDWHERLEALARRLGVEDSARLRGDSPTLLDELARASVFVMTSRHEGFPMVLLEAMSVGLPVVAYDCPTGPRDIVTEGVDGHVVPDGRTRLLAETLGRLMADRERRKRLGDAALETVKRYQIEGIADRWSELFGELTEAKGSGPTRRWRAASTLRAPG